MRKYSYLVAILLLPAIVSGQQSIKKFVRETQSAITSIEPDSTNYEDLETIGTAIGNATIVLLGEQDHGDAPTYLAKTRLIKYLHEKKGFTVLAFESDFFGLNEGWDNLPKQEKLIDTFLHKNITTVWTDCITCQGLFYNFIPETYRNGKPLIVTGFDSEIFFSYSSTFLYPKLDSVLKRVKAPISQLPNYAAEIYPLIKNWYANLKDSAKFNNTNNYLSDIKKQLSVLLGNANFWTIVADNLLNNNLKFKYALNDPLKASQIRDSLMAVNLKWLTETKFAGQKIIVWAANTHIRKFSGNFPIPFLNTVQSMGSIFTSDAVLEKKSFVIGFTSYEGYAGRLGSQKYTLNKLRSNSFENWIDKSSNYAFVNFRNYTGKDELFYMSGINHNNYEGLWNKIYDGVFFIRKMYSCTP
ncbi:erythromycin esterase family protein [Ferruginibacter paludis]|uniref:erythromycin esterase family protein n=1 Tax=Ferruginibacter paludis TaxID=1310417 RepID=UPI0025B52EDE|nr:erythromycin esterase family protein [Ferruginibacter paludis]MDN3656818.1 erythromycin esterase family protein [Ferruginibacter paludis]